MTSIQIRPFVCGGLFGLAALAAMVIGGCGGNAAPVAGVTVGGGGGGGCGGAFSGGTLTIQYPARSRGFVLTHPFSSALSAKIVIKGAAPAGSGSPDVNVNIGRDTTQPGAHSETYNLPTLATGTFPVTATFYAGSEQSGAVVGSASATETVTCSGQSLTSISLTTTAKYVAVTPATLTVGGGAQQLVFTVLDASNTVVPVTAGSATFSTTGSAATVTPDGIATPVSAGAVQVTASVDGLTSPPVTITVNSATGTTYRIVDLGVGSALTTGRPLNDNGLALFVPDSTSQAEVVDVNSLVTTGLGIYINSGGINNNGLVVGAAGANSYYWQTPTSAPNTLSGAGEMWAANDQGNIIGESTTSTAIYWDSVASDSTLLGAVGGDPIHWVEPMAINASKVIVGIASYATAFSACYYPSPNAGQATLLPGMGATRSAAEAINDSGVIVGYADATVSTEYAVVWDTPTSAPRSLGTIGVAGNAEAFGINNSGVIVGIDAGAIDSNRAFVYTASSGMKGLFDLCDSTRNGWTLSTATFINNKGWIYGTGISGQNRHGFVAIPNPPPSPNMARRPR